MKILKSPKCVLLTCIGTACWSPLSAAAAQGSFGVGDLLVSIQNGVHCQDAVLWCNGYGRPRWGTEIQSMMFNESGVVVNGEVMGGTFDPYGIFFVAESSGSTLSEFTPLAPPAPLYGYSTVYPIANTDPRSAVFDSAGNMYVGERSMPIFKYEQSQRTLWNNDPPIVPPYSPVQLPVDGSWIEIGPDSRTLYYTDEAADGVIHRFDLVSMASLTSWPALPRDLRGGNNPMQMRALLMGGMVVAHDLDLLRLDASGNTVQTYTPPQTAGGQWMAAALSTDGKTFWAGNNDGFDGGSPGDTGLMCQFNLITGRVLGCVTNGPNDDPDVSGACVWGLSTYGVNLCGVNGGGGTDPTFNGLGTGPNSGTVVAVARQPDGKILIGGSFTSVNGQPRAHIARLWPSGAVDSTFSVDQNATKINGVRVTSIAVQADGSIVLGGDFTSPRRYVARTDATGTWDASFNAKSVSGLNAVVNVVEIDAGGNILVADDGGDILRLKSDGSLDNRFSANADDPIYAVAIQPDGRIVIGGQFNYLGSSFYPYLARLSSNGVPDITFHPNPSMEVTAVAIQPDGAILFGGDFTSVGGISRNYIARVSASGALDSTFNPNCNNRVTSFGLLPNGGIMIAGNFTMVGGSTGRYGLARLYQNGAPDASFNANAVVANGVVASMFLSLDCDIVIGGSFSTAGGSAFNRVARIMNY